MPMLLPLLPRTPPLLLPLLRPLTCSVPSLIREQRFEYLDDGYVGRVDAGAGLLSKLLLTRLGPRRWPHTKQTFRSREDSWTGQ